MNYRLVYACDDDEFTYYADSLDEVNHEIGELHKEKGGVTILCVEEDQDGPRTWAVRYDPVPPAGTQVRDKLGILRTVVENARVDSPDSRSFSWRGALEMFGPLTEVVETEVEAAARRLRDEGFPKRAGNVKQQTYDDMRTIVAHALIEIL